MNSKRTLERPGPEWVVCDYCGSSDTTHTTYPDCPDGYGYDGDSLRCNECGAVGQVRCDGEEPAWTSWDWPEVSDG